MKLLLGLMFKLGFVSMFRLLLGVTVHEFMLISIC